MIFRSLSGGPYRSNPILVAKTLLCSFQFEFSGDFGEGETPVPIPNTAVKPLRADGTARASVWESRSSPGSIFERPLGYHPKGLCFGVRRWLAPGRWLAVPEP
jgi:hypothetical protein